MLNQILTQQKTSPQMGALAGALATLPMTAVMLAAKKLETGSARPILPEKVTTGILREAGLKSKVQGVEREALTWTSHLAFGAGAAALYPFFKKAFGQKSIMAPGAFYGLIVWAGSYWSLLPSLNIKSKPSNSPTRDNVMGVASHLVWGVALAGCYHLLCRKRQTTNVL